MLVPQGENKALYVLILFLRKRKKYYVLEIFDFCFFFFLANIGRKKYRDLYFVSDCKLLLLLYIMDLPLLSVCI